MYFFKQSKSLLLVLNSLQTCSQFCGLKSMRYSFFVISLIEFSKDMPGLTDIFCIVFILVKRFFDISNSTTILRVGLEDSTILIALTNENSCNLVLRTSSLFTLDFLER